MNWYSPTDLSTSSNKATSDFSTSSQQFSPEYSYATSQRRTEPSRTSWLLSGAVLAAVAMYFGDPERGRERRTMAQDRLRNAADRSRTTFNTTSRDLTTRVQQIRSQAGTRVQEFRSQAAPKVEGLRSQASTLLSRTTETLNTQMQNGSKLREMAMQETWPQNLRTAAAIGGGTLSAVGMMRRSPAGSLLAMAGLLLLTRGLANKPLKTMAASFRPGSQGAIRMSKTIFIDAPPERVFDLWSKFENFPRFMSNIQEVRDLGNNRSHWVVSGPAGVPVEWDAVTTESRRPHVLGWRSEPGSTVDNSGIIRLQPEAGGTRVTVELSYTPPGGTVGHAVAEMFGKDPKQQMDEDLARMKAFIETGNTPADAAKPGDSAAAGSVLH